MHWSLDISVPPLQTADLGVCTAVLRKESWHFSTTTANRRHGHLHSCATHWTSLWELNPIPTLERVPASLGCAWPAGARVSSGAESGPPSSRMPCGRGHSGGAWSQCGTSCACPDAPAGWTLWSTPCTWRGGGPRTSSGAGQTSACAGRSCSIAHIGRSAASSRWHTLLPLVGGRARPQPAHVHLNAVLRPGSWACRLEGWLGCQQAERMGQHGMMAPGMLLQCHCSSAVLSTKYLKTHTKKLYSDHVCTPCQCPFAVLSTKC